MRNLIRTRYVRSFLLVAIAAVGLGVVAPSPNAAGGPLTVTAVTWDVIGLDSNNVNTGPNVFPVGIRVCNTGSDPVTNVVGTWAWKTSQNAFTGPAEGTTVSVGTMAGGYCRQVFFEVTLNRSPSSRLKSRDYQITMTGDGGLSTSGPQRQLYVEKLVSQGRNNTKKLAGPGGCNLAYTVCDLAPTNLVIGKTYTYKFYAETSTAYQQLETFVNFPASVVQVVSTSATYSNPSGATSSSLYADACGWSTVPTNRSCVGPPNIPGGKAGGRVVVTYTVRAVAPGSGTVKSTIYDFSGSSYHYNSDHDSFALISGPLTARYGLDTTIVGNGKVTSAPAGTLTNGTSSGIDCGATTVICSVGYGTGTNVTLTAQPLGGDIFVGWSGDGCSGVSLTCIVAMSQSRLVTATFTGVMSYPLEVSKTGSGSVTADVGSLNCGATCTSMYADGTVVTLTASATTGWTFNGWSGEGCGGTGTCQVTMSQARSVSAAFIEETFPLSVSVIGNGTVAASAGTISCGNGNTFCSDSYGSGVVVTLTATPGSGQTFIAWVGGDCVGIALTCNVTMSQARSATALFSGVASYPLEVGVGGSGSGSVTSDVGGINCGATCSATYADGTIVTLTAAPAGGSSFVGWSGDCSGTSTTCTVTMSQARSAFANFGAPQTLTVTKAGSGTGTVTSDVAGINCGATCSASFGDGTVVTLTASVSSGSIFTGWSGDCSGTGTCTVTMSSARSVTATFVAAYTLAVTRTGSGTGTVTSDVGGLSCGVTCSVDYADGTVVTLSASAAAGSRFVGWSGACSGTSTCTVTMSAARNVTATFIALYTLTVTKSGSGTGSVSGSGINCGPTCSLDYDDGTVVTLTATASSGSRFAGWSGACSGTSTCTVTMSVARNVTASFIALYTLTVTKSGSGTGTVTSDVAGVNCGATCSADYDDGTVVSLTATAASGSRFAGWSGAGCSGTGICTVTMSAARNVTASFITVYTLTVTRSGSGSGNVAGNGIDCGPTCSLDYDDGTVVTLTATAASGSRFNGWSGAGCSGTGTCTVTMSAARSVTASFIALYTLTVTKSGSGMGTVTSDVGGMSCGATCSADFDDSTVVTLTATATSGSRFNGWSGAGCSGTGTCMVTMSAARNVTASFIAVYALTVTKSGSGTGTVTSDVGGVSCGATCSADYDDGTVVTLTASVASGSRFTGWSGAGCSGTGTCTVTMSAARNVTASFIALYTLTATKSGSGSGSVAGNGIDCGPTCSLDYDDGTVVTLTATPASGSRFAGWSGACSGTSTCSVTMSAARNVTASFIALYTLTATKSGSGTGTVTSDVGGVSCGTTCSVDFDDGTVVTLTATASASRFTGWSGAGCSGTGTCTVTMSAARNVTASFIALYALTVTKSGSGAGSVSGSGINCGPTCSLDYDDGTVVTLTATAASGSRFDGWSGACSGTSTCTVTMSAARNVTASFIALYALTVTKSGTGTVTSDVGGLSCGATCTADYDDGTVVTLTASAAPGSRFTGWSGACSGTSTCSVTMSAARNVTASFVAFYTLTVTKSGSGSGSADASGIDCGATCSADYDDGTSVTLTATPASGSRFNGWSGACSGTSTCTVTMSSARNVTAEFATVSGPVVPAVHKLTVAKTGSGTGVVTATGIDCGATCGANYFEGTSVALTASPASGSHFTGWSGESCSGTGSCTVEMSEARHVTAAFVYRIVRLQIVVAGRGTVVGASAGIRCRTACSRQYDARRRVTLVARPRTGHWFTGWSGACHGTAPRCTVTMARARQVRARFARELELRLQVTAGLVYHLPHEHALIKARATWRGRPLNGANVRLVVTCPRQRVDAVVQTGRNGRVVFPFGSRLPNATRIYTCRVTARIAARGTTATSPRPGTLRFIHPLWLETKHGKNGSTVVRIWGRSGEVVELLADGRTVAHARIRRQGWVEITLPGIRLHHLWVRGARDHHSHVISA